MKAEKPDKPHVPMNEGTEAFERFRHAAKAVLSVPKSALLPDPFKKSRRSVTTCLGKEGDWD